MLLLTAEDIESVGVLSDHVVDSSLHGQISVRLDVVFWQLVVLVTDIKGCVVVQEESEGLQ